MSPSPTDVPVAHRRKCIVVVEDDPEILDLETFLLSAEGFEVVPVPDGEQAAAAVKRSGADLVLLDLMLPGKHGNDVLAELAGDPATASVPVIVVSAFVEQLEPSPLVRQIIPKPFDVSELLDGISRELGAT